MFLAKPLSSPWPATSPALSRGGRQVGSSAGHRGPPPTGDNSELSEKATERQGQAKKRSGRWMFATNQRTGEQGKEM